MPLVFGCIAPHGYQCLPELTPRPEEAAATREALTEMGRQFEALSPDTVVVLTPHGIRIDGMMCISASVRAAGSLAPDVSVDFAVDQSFAEEITRYALTGGVPVAHLPVPHP